MWLRPNEKPISHQTCIIFDWDDTILCTSHIMPVQYLCFDNRLEIPATLKLKLD